MNPQSSDSLRQELLDEFYAECDELLGQIGHLLRGNEIEAVSAQHSSLLQDLFQALHSLKGNCGIVGLAGAGEAVHSIETVVRAAVRQEIALSKEIFESLHTSMERIREYLVAHRRKAPLPHLEDITAQWENLMSERRLDGGAAVHSSLTSDRREEGFPEVDNGGGPTLWICYFSPTQELEKQGVGIDAVRRKLAALGEVKSCVPIVNATSGLRFNLTVILPTAPNGLEEWAKLGVRFEPLEEGSALGPVRPLGEPITGDRRDFDLTPSHLVRVDLSQLDELMRITAEILVHRFRLKDHLGDLLSDDDDLKHLDHSLGRSLRDLSSTIYRVRLVPIAEVFSRMPYVVKELTRDAPTGICLRIEGEETEIDKFLVERLREPLLHLVRNAMAHAFEPPEVRRGQGKPAQGTIVLRARRSGDAVEIRVSDDGKGIELNSVMDRAAALGFGSLSGNVGASLLKVLCQPGFSTRDTPDHSAGRGMGMAIVARTVAELGGTLRLTTTVGKGTDFTLRLPLRLSIVDALLVTVASELCAIPQTHVDQVLQIPSTAVRKIEGSEWIPYQDTLLRLVRLRKFFGAGLPSAPEMVILVILSEAGAYGLVVDQVRSRKEIVVSSFCDPLIRVAGVAGATELGGGRPVLVIAPEALPDVCNPTPAGAGSSLDPVELTQMNT